MLFGKPKRIVKRILIVEDEPLTAFDNETMLEELGYTVVATHDRVKEALATLEREQVDLIMCDVKLTGDRSGIDLARIARQKSVPVLFATGLVPDEAPELAIGCLMKPYSQRTMKAALAAVDQHLQGGKAKAPKGLILYASPTA
jgi:two-component system, response regulator PdtaR